jgi:predicted O-methyltransferase YrrM
VDAVRDLIAPEAPGVTDARTRAAALDPPGPVECALIAWAAATVDATHVVEVGSAGGVSGLWLAAALAGRGVVTSIEPDAHAHALASESFEVAGVGDRIRSIAGEPQDVLPRLTDGGYDLVLLQATPSRTPLLVPDARRLLRTGGILIGRGLPDGDATRRLVERLQEDGGFAVTAIDAPSGGGSVVLATRLADPDPAATD